MSIKSVHVVKDNTKQLAAALKSLTNKSVYVGIPLDKAPRPGEPISNAVIGYVQEHGMPEQNVPARPFLVPGVTAVKAQLASIFRKMGENALDGNLTAVEQGMAAAGLVAQVQVKKTITDVIPPPLAPSTLAGRRSRGRTGTTPLIDTGELLNSISFVVRK